MAVITNTVDTYVGANSNREMFVDGIFEVSMKETPFLAYIAKRSTTTGTLHTWQLTNLRAAAANARIDGDEVTSFQNTVTTKATNVCQISTLPGLVSGTQEAVLKSGSQSEYGKQVVFAMKNLMRDIEFTLTNNQAPVSPGATNTARQLRPLEGWYTTNVSRGVGGASGTTSAAATDGTQRAFTKTLLETVQQSVFSNSGPGSKTLMLGPAQVLVWNTFDWNSTVKRQDTSDGRLTAAIEVVATSFGEVKVVINAFQRNRTAHLIDDDMFEVPFLRELQDMPLAKTGDAEKFLVLAEYTLQSSNERSSGVIADLT